MSKINKVIGLSLSTKNNTQAAKTLKRDLIKGNNKYTEHYAYKHIIPYVDEKDEEKALRIASLIANNNITQNQDINFGSWVRIKANGDKKAIERLSQKLSIITNLKFEQAVEQLNRLINQLETNGDSFNWIDLGNTLFYWGNGITDNSIKVRQRLLKDFYRYIPQQEDTEENEK